MKALHMVTFILLAIGGLNWLLIGLGGDTWNVVRMALGSMPALERIVYILVGLSAVVEIFSHTSNCTCCSTSPAATEVK